MHLSRINLVGSATVSGSSEGIDALFGCTNGVGRAASFGGTVRLCSALPDVPVLVAFQRLKLSLQID